MLRGIGYDVSFRDPKTGSSRKHKIGITNKKQKGVADVANQAWLATYLADGPGKPKGRPIMIPSNGGAVRSH